MIALIFCGDIKYCPYIKRYIEVIDKNNSNYIVYFWNRSSEVLNLGSNYKYFNEASKLNKIKISKLTDFLNYRKWLIKQLNNDSPDQLILLSTLSGVLLKDYLKNKKYIFDIRDYSYENIAIYRKIENEIIENSYFTVLSSKGFKAFLPSKEYIIAHNFNRNDIKAVYQFKKEAEPITFVWNGLIRYFEFQKQYLDLLKNDSRFLIKYHGDGPELDLYRKYAARERIHNIVFTGAYKNEYKADLLKDANILNNCYGYTRNAGNKLRYAVSNKFYDGIIYHIPQLVEEHGYKSQWAKNSGVGISLHPDSEFVDKLYNYYCNLDEKKFDNDCNKAIKKVIDEDNDFIRKVEEFVIN